MQAAIPMSDRLTQQIADWPQFLASGVLVMVRLSGLMVFAPIFSSAAIAPRIKAGFVIAMTILLAPVVGTLPHARVELDMVGLLGELAVGLTFGFALTLINEALMFAGQMLGMEFSFSLVNLLDPNSNIQTPVLGQLLSWLGILVLIGAGLDRSLLAAVMRSFAVVPVGQAVMHAGTGAALAAMAGGVFLAGLQLAAPVIAAALDGGDCGGAGGADVAAAAGDGGEHSAEDAGLVCGADRIAGGVAGVD